MWLKVPVGQDGHLPAVPSHWQLPGLPRRRDPGEGALHLEVDAGAGAEARISVPDRGIDAARPSRVSRSNRFDLGGWPFGHRMGRALSPHVW